MQETRSLVRRLPREVKKRIKGDQSPRNDWSGGNIREVKISTSSDGPVINLAVGKGKTILTWRIDSGAERTVIDEVTYRKTFPGGVLEPMPPNLFFTNADGSPLHMLGFFETIFWFGMESKTEDVYVCKGVTKTRLLGAPLLGKFSQWGIDNERGMFIADGVSIPLVTIHGSPPSICRVQVCENINIPARCSRFIKGMLPHRYKPTEFLFKPCERVFRKKKLLLPTCVVASDVFDGSVTVKVTNPNNEELQLGKGTDIGKVSSNLEDYVFTEAGVEEISHTIGSVQSESKEDLEGKLKRENKDLFQLYKEAGDIIQGEERLELLRLLYRYREAFSVHDHDIGTTNILKHKIVPKSDKIVYRRQYRLSEAQHKQMDEEVENLLRSGVIKESMSPYNNPVLMVPKKEPGKWRFCLDCRYINDLTQDQYFPLPRIDEIMDSLAGANVYIVIDMIAGYHQVDMEEESSEMCAFSTRKGHYQYKKMPMGLRGSGMTFQKMVTLLMSGMLYVDVLAYLDDCILYGASVKQLLGTFEEVLSRFCKAGLKLKPRKCKLFQEELVYLGFLVNKEGIRPNPERVTLIKDLPTPSGVTEVQAFLGKVNYYRKFIPKLAEIAHPLYELTKKSKKSQFRWEAEHQQAFDQLKSILCSDQVMGHPRYDRDFILDVDASDYALGVELSQKDDNGDERPVFYGSRHLEKSERSYSATARETLAAVFGCEYFKQYLQGRKFILRSDHNPLVWLRSMKEPKRPYSGWIVRLEQFQYEIQYRPGSQHTNADFNSRVRPAVGQCSEYRSVGVQTEDDGSSEPKKSGVGINTSVQDQCTLVPGSVHTSANILQGVATVTQTDGKPHTGAEQGDITPSTDLLVELQNKDADIGPVVRKLTDVGAEQDFTPRGEYLWRIRKKLRVQDGLLMRLQRVEAGLEPIEQIVLPQCLKRMVLESLHDSDLAGHFGVRRTMARVRIRYYWPGYLTDVEDWCKTCEICQQKKDPPNKNTAPLTSIDTGQGPFEQIALDILKLPPTNRGNKYLLVIQDYFSKWVEAFPLRRTIEPSVAQCLLSGWISRFGCPYSILSDQGPEFESHLFRCLNEMLGVKKLRTTTYHPRTDGMVERGNRTLISILSKYAEQEKDWDLRMPLALFALRTSEHATTGFSPFRLTYGREARLPWDICYGPAPKTPLPHVNWVAERKKEMTKVFKLVKEHTLRKQQHQKDYFNKNLKGQFQVFQEGDAVMYCDPVLKERGGKLTRPWTGPHTVETKLSDALYKILLDTGEDIVVNAERLKKHHPRESNHSQEGTVAESDSEDESEEEERQQPPQQQLEPPEVDLHAHVELQQQEGEVRGHTPGPLMREGGKFWSNVDTSNILPGTRLRK